MALIPIDAQAASEDYLTTSTLWHKTSGYTSPAYFTIKVSVHNPRSNILNGNLSILPGSPSSASLTYFAPIYLGPNQTRSFQAVMPSSSYTVDLSENGSLLAHIGSPSIPSNSDFAIGVLSDSKSLDTRLPAVSSGSLSAFYFDNDFPFPSTPSRLIGLPAILISSYATSLSSDQISSLRSYVSSGGNLILVGGSNWRNTLSRLPSDLVPYSPSRDARLSPQMLNLVSPKMIAEPSLGGFTGTLNFGEIAFGSGESPLVIEALYGLGQIIELTYDPDASLQNNDNLAYMLGWQQALLRAQVTHPRSLASYTDVSSSILSGNTLNSINNPQTSPLSPFSVLPILLLLLLVYMVLAVPLNFYFLRKRRALFWITLPLLAILFTSLEYFVGFASRGGIYLDSTTEIRLLAPNQEIVIAEHDTSFALSGNHTISWNPEADWRPQLNGSQIASISANYSLSTPHDVNLKNVSVYLPSSVFGIASLPNTHAISGNVKVAGNMINASFRNDSSHTFYHPHLILPNKREIILKDQTFLPHTTIYYSGSLPGIAFSPLASPYSISKDFEISNNSALLSVLSDDTEFPRLDDQVPKGKSQIFILAPIPLSTDIALSPKANPLRLISSSPSLNSGGLQNVYDINIPEHFTSLSLIARPVSGSAEFYNPETQNWDKVFGGGSNAFVRSHMVNNRVLIRIIEDGVFPVSVVINS